MFSVELLNGRAVKCPVPQRRYTMQSPLMGLVTHSLATVVRGEGGFGVKVGQKLVAVGGGMTRQSG